ncbi:MAG: hypothetical protein M3421_01785, partial [Bacteroidota bacterium]|nr:hypothetical protein [Bacteroidota bacterium]
MSAEYNQRYKSSYSEDELDLRRLFINFIGIIKKRKRILLTFLTIGVVLGTLLFLTRSPLYQSSMVINSNILTAANSASLIETLDFLIKEGNHKELSKKLGFSENAVKQLREIKVNEIEDEDALELTNIY